MAIFPHSKTCKRQWSVLVPHVLIGYRKRYFMQVIRISKIQNSLTRKKPKPSICTKKYIQLDLFVATIIMILRIIYLLLLFREWYETFGNNIFYSFPHNIKSSMENAAFIYKRNEFSTFLLDSKIETYFIYIDHAAILKVFG